MKIENRPARIAELEAEVTRLRKAIENAPHAEQCDYKAIENAPHAEQCDYINNCTVYRCTCWKKNTLEGK